MNTRRAWLVGLFLATLGGCKPAEPPWNVLLVTFDTTRADRIGCYGNTRIQTPTLDALAQDGIRFSRALSAVPITAPSHSSIHTGRYPIAHGFRDNGLFVLGEEQKTLAEMLAERGYATAAAVGSFPLTARFGLNQGFSFFDDHLTGAFEDYTGQRAVPKDRLFFDERRAAQVNEAILPWIEANSKQPFFAWVHYFDPHQPFEPEPPYAELYADDLYNGEIAYSDAKLGFLLGRLRDLGVLDRTLVVMTADHGEGLGEHHEITHAMLAYNSTLHVPLIVRPPAGTEPLGRTVDEWVTTVDVAPTILDLLGIDVPDTVQGRSLTSLWRNPELPQPRRMRYAENLSPRLAHGLGELRVLFDGSLKYIYGPTPELYDLDADPHELVDLAPNRPAEAARLRRTLQSFLDRYAVANASEVESLDDETRQRLAALGYLQSSGGDTQISERLLEGGVAPATRVDDLNDLSSAKHLLFKQRYGDALVYTSRLLAETPESPLYLELHASALVELGRLDEAWATIERLELVGSAPPPLLLRLLSKRFFVGEREAATTALAAYLAKHPENALGHWILASFHGYRGEAAAERAALEQAVALDPDFVPARLDLAVLLDQAGVTGAAEEHLLAALGKAPYAARTHYNYGTFLLRAQRLPEAVQRFERAVELAPNYLRARLGLIATEVASGDLERAQAHLRRLQDLAPESSEAATAASLLQ